MVHVFVFRVAVGKESTVPEASPSKQAIGWISSSIRSAFFVDASEAVQSNDLDQVDLFGDLEPIVSLCFSP